jgi:myo-inositol-1-phosphate synthase
VGLTTELKELRDLPLPAVEDLVFGGHEVGPRTVAESARDFQRRAGVLTDRLLDGLAGDLDAAQAEVRPGYPSRPVRPLAAGKGRVAPGPAAAFAAIQADLKEFKKRHALADVVVVNVATTEPLPEPRPEWDSLAALRAALDDGRADVFPPSVLYACAALDAGYPYVNFTPSTGSSIRALDELARARSTVHAGRDGKTGETLVKTTLAPLFACRNLRGLAWEGYNMLGNPDGESLRDPRARSAKCSSKDRSLKAILGEEGHSAVHIDFVPSLDDWKVAYDYIHFEGFLGARMSMQFTWQGCDSALAAPLVLDLARLAALSRAGGEKGALDHLACFFKDPYGVEVHAFPAQFEMLRAYAARARKGAESRSA